MACRICGVEKAEYRNRSRMFLCAACHKTTPAKVDRDTFEREYWGNEDVPHGIRNEFWDDYKTSSYGSVSSYKEATTSNV